MSKKSSSKSLNCLSHTLHCFLTGFNNSFFTPSSCFGLLSVTVNQKHYIWVLVCSGKKQRSITYNKNDGKKSKIKW